MTDEKFEALGMGRSGAVEGKMVGESQKELSIRKRIRLIKAFSEKVTIGDLPETKTRTR